MRVLLVDDDEVLLRASAAALRRCGLTVDTALGGEDALEVLDEGSFDVVLVDLMMPRMSGIELVRKLQTQYPELRIVLTSSFPLSPGQLDRMGLAGVTFLPKPSSLIDTLAALRGNQPGRPSPAPGRASDSAVVSRRA